MPWVRRRLRGVQVWARCDGNGELRVGSDGRVDVLYQPGGRLYRAAMRNLEPDDDPTLLSDEEAAPGELAEARNRTGRMLGRSRGGQSALPLPSSVEGVDAVHVYADGACAGNPGPMGIGVVLLNGGERKEVSEYLGVGTNNIAELTAIQRALELSPRDRTVVLHSDSAYVLGLLGQGWKAKANQELVARLRQMAAGFRDLRLVKVAGHAGVKENERCDKLAREAIARAQRGARP
ncbi:MAG: ribonuclease H [Myxococcales bacterium]|nr:ribonuclease H [Myxococcales bacterium]